MQENITNDTGDWTVIAEFKTDHSSSYLFFFWTSFRSCVCSSAVFCIRTSQRLQPFSATTSGTSENSKTKEVMSMLSFEIRQLLNGFINLILLGMLLQVLLNILLTFIYSSIVLPVSTEIGILEVFWSICFKKINRWFEEKVIKLMQNQQSPKFNKASAFLLNSLTLLI